MKTEKSRSLAALFSLLQPGLGQLYRNQIEKAVIMLTCFCLLILLCIQLHLGSSLTGLLILLAASFALTTWSILDAARKTEAPVNFRWYNQWYFCLVLLILLQIFHPSISAYYEAYKVPSQSMFPTFQIGDHFIADKKYYQHNPIARGDVVVLHRQDDPATTENEANITLIKRVIAIGGDKVQVTRKRVYLNGKPISEPYAVFQEGGISEGELPETEVPPSTVFLLGDNRDHSKDSRFWSERFISSENIDGKAVYIYWPTDRMVVLGAHG